MLFYRAALPLSRSDPELRRRGDPPAPQGDRVARGGSSTPASRRCWCWSTCVRARRSPSSGPGSGSSTATAWRYVEETVALLAARSPKLAPGAAQGEAGRAAYLVLDGTLIPIDRVTADRPFYSGKHRKHGMNLQVIAIPGRDHPVGVRGAARRGPRPEGRPDLGHPARSWSRRDRSPWPTRATRAPDARSSPRTRARTSPSPRSRPTAPTPGSAAPANARTPSSRPGRSSASYAAAPAGRPPRQGHPRPAEPRAQPRMKKVHSYCGNIPPREYEETFAGSRGTAPRKAGTEQPRPPT